MCYYLCDRVGRGIDTKEANEMKRNWLRGILLGVSTALLLSGGVAVAQGPVCDNEASVLGEYEEFGDGWSQHWTNGDNAAGLQFV